MPLKCLKKSLPFESSKFTIPRGIYDGIDFKWRLSSTLRRRYLIVDSFNKIIRMCTHKHGVDMLTSVSQAKKLDEKNRKTLWMNAISQEIENLNVFFDVLEDEANITIGHNKASGHLVFDTRMMINHKDLQVKDRNRTPLTRIAYLCQICVKTQSQCYVNL